MGDTLMHTYARQPVSFSKGKGAWLWDDTGKPYLDALCGIAVTGLGHAHPAVTTALCEQASQLLHTSNLFEIPHQRSLGEALTRLSGMDKAFFCNSGAEANEAAIKIARLHGKSKGVKSPAIIVMENSFHGRTLATLSATGNRKVQAGFEPLVQGFVRVPYNDLEAVRTIAENNQNVVAVLVEPIQGESGINIPDADYLNSLRAICDEHQWLLMLDEIQSGMGRSGKWFCFQHSNITPDVMTLAKSLGNGMPIGACLARGTASDLLQPGSHGTTFGGNPLACRAALAVIQAMEQDNLVQNAEIMGNKILSLLAQGLKDNPQVEDIRGQGLLLAVQLKTNCSQLVKQGLDNGIVLNVTKDKIVRLLPPLIINDSEAEQIAEKVCHLVHNFQAV
ncbi:MAG: acetylornithine transaminase [Gammaproteobacteria bacterium]|nr:acetylornithine transaminase [Gammaproteobacteria bacterium]MDH5799841.1 acetylornithine transaminase [Gammaproteobacteria bacterium]